MPTPTPIFCCLLLALASVAIGLVANDAVAESFVLANGDKLTGDVVERDAERIVIEHPVFGRVEIPVTELEPPEPPDPGAFGLGILRGWDRSIEISASGSNGNSDTTSLRGGIDLSSETERRRWNLSSRYFWTQTDGSTEKNNARVLADRNWLFPGSPWFMFTNFRYDYDQFREWDHRLNSSIGPGYELIRSERLDLTTGVGLSVVREFGGEDDEVALEGLWGFSGTWRIAEGHKLTFSNVLFPSLTEAGEYRNLSNVDWKMSLSEEYGISLKFGVENEYISDVAEGTENNDLRYYSGISYDF